MPNALLKGLPPTHPGELLRTIVLPAAGLSKSEVARRLGVTRPVLYALLAEEQAVSPLMAHKLSRLFGSTPETWAGMQQAYDLAKAGEKSADMLAKIERVDADEEAAREKATRAAA
ncbi:MAG: HigA family addiction module antitoxin [Pseudomonadota bacterium]